MALTADQVQIIRSTVPVLETHGGAITRSFYTTLLNEVPELNNVFNRANQANNHQAMALAGALHAYASNIDDLGVLSPAVEKICQKHASLFIRPEQYEVVGTYLLQAMSEVLNLASSSEILEAWGAAYWQLANIMMQREEQLGDNTDGWKDWRDFTISDKVKESEEITSFYLKPVDGNNLPSFLPGQYISILTEVSKLQHLQPRQYSLSDAPNQDYYRISVKKELGLDNNDPDAPTHPGYVSNVLHDEKKIGATLKVSHPAGEFFLDPEKERNNPVVLVSAGVGLTPMISILNTLINTGSKQRISFIHGTRDSLVRAFHPYLRVKEYEHPNVSYTTFIKNPDPARDIEGDHYSHTGRMDLTKLDREKDLLVDNKQTRYFICGPDSFMTDMTNGLVEMGVEADRIKMERFGTGVMSAK